MRPDYLEFEESSLYSDAEVEEVILTAASSEVRKVNKLSKNVIRTHSLYAKVKKSLV